MRRNRGAFSRTTGPRVTSKQRSSRNRTRLWVAYQPSFDLTNLVAELWTVHHRGSCRFGERIRSCGVLMKQSECACAVEVDVGQQEDKGSVARTGKFAGALQGGECLLRSAACELDLSEDVMTPGAPGVIWPEEVVEDLQAGLHLFSRLGVAAEMYERSAHRQTLLAHRHALLADGGNEKRFRFAG